MKPSVARVGDDHDHAAVLRVPVHDLAHERQEAPLHVGETLALAVARLEVLLDGPLARQLHVYRARIFLRFGLDAEVDLDGLGRQRQRQVVTEGDGVGRLDRTQVRARVDGDDRRVGSRFGQRLGLLDALAGQRIASPRRRAPVADCPER